MSKKLFCKNYKTKVYNGKENTPLGKGYYAEGEKVNKVMKGKDGNMYKVIKIKNGKKIKNIKRSKRGEPFEWELFAEGEYEDDPNIYLKKGQDWNNKDSFKVVFPDNNEYIINSPRGIKFEVNGKKYIYDVFNKEVKKI